MIDDFIMHYINIIFIGLNKNKGKVNPHVFKTLSLCGDLNKGYIPKNPMNQNILGTSYPL